MALKKKNEESMQGPIMAVGKPAWVCKFLPPPPPHVNEQTADVDGADIALSEEPEKDSETIFCLTTHNWKIKKEYSSNATVMKFIG